MGLKSLMKYLQKCSAVTPVTPKKIMGLQPKPAWIGLVPLVTPVTLQLNDTRINAQFAPFDEAVNDPVPSALHSQPSTESPAHTITDKLPEQTFMACADTWLHLDRAYQSHHFKCATCKAAGLGYGLRCGVGAALWAAYGDGSSPSGEQQLQRSHLFTKAAP